MRLDTKKKLGLLKTFSEANFIVFDIETTGGNPQRNGITEVYAIRYRAGEVEDSFYSLVNPKMRIPPIVRRMTGIHNGMLKDAPTIDAVMPRLVEFIGDDILVSHNTIGDLKFLSYFALKVCKVDLQNFFLCTHLLSEKLFPESPDKSLTGLGKYLQLEQSGQFHRAEADAKLTLQLHQKIIEQLDRRRIHTIESAVRFQGDAGSSLRLGIAIPSARFASLPSKPGVFQLKDRNGQLSFVSSVKNLKRDVESLRKLSVQPKRMLKLLLGAHDLEVIPSENLLDAMLMEAELAESQSSTYPAQKWHLRHSATAFFKPQGAQETLIGTSFPPAKITELYGPVRDRKLLEGHLDELAEVGGFPRSRNGVRVPNELLPVVKAWLLGNLNDFARRSFLDVLSPFSSRLRWSKKELLRQFLLARKLRSLDSGFGLSSLRETSGWVVAKGAGIERIYPVSAGKVAPSVKLPSGVSWADWARTHKGIELIEETMLDQGQKVDEQPTPLSLRETYRLLSVHWFIHQSASGDRRSYSFHPVDELYNLAQSGKIGRSSREG